MIPVLLVILALVGPAVGVLVRSRRRCPECGHVFPTADDMLHHLDRCHL